MFTIVGSGFGLYGYLPAIALVGHPIVLPVRLKDKLEARPELARTWKLIRWVDSDEDALALATTVVVATPPEQQFSTVLALLSRPRLRALVLEKPLAATPHLASQLHSRLRQAQICYRIGYTFLFTDWYPLLPWPADASGHVDIRWSFLAHHFASGLNTWKRVHHRGGGVLRYYSIHMLALLAHRGYTKVAYSAVDGANKEEPETWSALLGGDGLPSCNVCVHSRSSIRRFEILSSSSGLPPRTLVNLSDPFDSEKPGAVGDARIASLARLLLTLERSEDKQLDAYYGRVNELWAQAEDACAAR